MEHGAFIAGALGRASAKESTALQAVVSLQSEIEYPQLSHPSAFHGSGARASDHGLLVISFTEYNFVTVGFIYLQFERFIEFGLVVVFVEVTQSFNYIGFNIQVDTF